MYDKTPVYPHQHHLPFAHEPLKSIYVFQRLLTTILLVPVWATYYSVFPRSFRPRPSWSISQDRRARRSNSLYGDRNQRPGCRGQGRRFSTSRDWTLLTRGWILSHVRSREVWYLPGPPPTHESAR